MASTSTLPAAERQVRAKPSGIPTYRIRTRFSNKTRKYKVAKPRDRTPDRGATRSRPVVPPQVTVIAPADDEAYILVMGPSGAGKTSFINLASDSHLPVSSGLGSCTSEVSLSEPFTLDGQTIRLIDTPGFDDATKSDGDVLNGVAEFFATEGRRFRSILYFHRISDVRMGATQTSFEKFRELVGVRAYPSVVVVTTRWNEVNSMMAEERETELQTKPDFFQPIVEAGGTMMRYARTPECTQRILRQALACAPVELAMQRLRNTERMSAWEIVPEAAELGYNELPSLLAERAPSSSGSDDDDDDDGVPPIIGALPEDTSSSSSGVSWGEWVLSFHPSLLGLLANMFHV